MDEVKASKLIELASRAVVGGTLAMAVAAFPPAALLVGYFQPAVDSLASWSLHRVTKTAELHSGLTEQQLIQRISSDETKLRLLAVTMEAARTSVTDYKLKVLGIALANGATANTGASVDYEIMTVRAVAALETQHFRLLRILADFDPGKDENGATRNVGLLIGDVRASTPDLEPDLVHILMGGLAGQGAVETYSGLGALVYSASIFGKHLLARMDAAGQSPAAT